jgi:hypothetical protein
VDAVFDDRDTVRRGGRGGWLPIKIAGVESPATQAVGPPSGGKGKIHKKGVTKVTLSIEPHVKVKELMVTLEIAPCRG